MRCVSSARAGPVRRLAGIKKSTYVFMAMFVCSAAALLAGCAVAPSQATRATTETVLDGTWEGSFTAFTSDDKGGRISFPINLKLTIHGKDARVFVRETSDHAWVEQGMPDSFVFDSRGSVGVIYTNRAGKIPTPTGSRWFETYLVAVAAKAPDQILVHWMRLVTNIDTPVDDPDHAGVSAGDGILKKT